MLFIESSAKAGINIKQLFKNLAQSLPGMDGGSKGGEPQNKADGGKGTDHGFKLNKPAGAGDETPGVVGGAKKASGGCCS